MMTDPVTITESAGAPYAWAGANFTWSDATAGKSWASANPSVYRLAITVALALSDACLGKTTKPVSEQLGLVDAMARSPTLRRSEVLGFSETYADLIAFVLRFLESFGVRDVMACGTHKAISELLPVTDQMVRATGKKLAEALGVGGAPSRALHKRLAEDLAWAQIQGLGVDKYLAEGFGLGDDLTRSADKEIHETLAFAETYTDLVAWVLAVAENLGLSEALGKHTTQPQTESLQMGDGLAWQAVKNVTQALALAEGFGRTVAYRRSIDEGLGLADSLKRACQMNVHEAFDLAEQYRRHANGVVSDMLVASTAITEQDFIDIMEAGHPPGFTDFRDFIQGDHTYRRALFRSILQSQNSDRGFIDALRVTVDVPDVFDRGSEQITAAALGIAVTFSRTFRVPPEVTITHKGGSTLAVPRLVGAVTTTGFSAVLEDSSGERVTGSFTWIAQGY